MHVSHVKIRDDCCIVLKLSVLFCIAYRTMKRNGNFARWLRNHGCGTIIMISALTGIKKHECEIHMCIRGAIPVMCGPACIVLSLMYATCHAERSCAQASHKSLLVYLLPTIAIAETPIISHW